MKAAVLAVGGSLSFGSFAMRKQRPHAVRKSEESRPADFRGVRRRSGVESATFRCRVIDADEQAWERTVNSKRTGSTV